MAGQEQRGNPYKPKKKQVGSQDPHCSHFLLPPLHWLEYHVLIHAPCLFRNLCRSWNKHGLKLAWDESDILPRIAGGQEWILIQKMHRDPCSYMIFIFSFLILFKNAKKWNQVRFEFSLSFQGNVQRDKSDICCQCLIQWLLQSLVWSGSTLPGQRALRATWEDISSSYIYSQYL